MFYKCHDFAFYIGIILKEDMLALRKLFFKKTWLGLYICVWIIIGLGTHEFTLSIAYVYNKYATIKDGDFLEHQSLHPKKSFSFPVVIIWWKPILVGVPLLVTFMMASMQARLTLPISQY